MKWLTQRENRIKHMVLREEAKMGASFHLELGLDGHSYLLLNVLPLSGG